MSTCTTLATLCITDGTTRTMKTRMSVWFRELMALMTMLSLMICTSLVGKSMLFCQLRSIWIWSCDGCSVRRKVGEKESNPMGDRVVSRVPKDFYLRRAWGDYARVIVLPCFCPVLSICGFDIDADDADDADGSANHGANVSFVLNNKNVATCQAQRDDGHAGSFRQLYLIRFDYM